jgi:hypothetical protein
LPTFSGNSRGPGQDALVHQPSAAQPLESIGGSVVGSIEMKTSMSTVVASSLALFLIGAFLNPALARSFAPEPGVRCNSSARICYVRGAPSIRMTQIHFGERAAQQLRRDPRRPQEQRRYTQRMFHPEAGVRCDRVRGVCHDRRGRPSAYLTYKYLGPRVAHNPRW